MAGRGGGGGEEARPAFAPGSTSTRVFKGCVKGASRAAGEGDEGMGVGVAAAVGAVAGSGGDGKTPGARAGKGLDGGEEAVSCRFAIQGHGGHFRTAAPDLSFGDCGYDKVISRYVCLGPSSVTPRGRMGRGA